MILGLLLNGAYLAELSRKSQFKTHQVALLLKNPGQISYQSISIFESSLLILKLVERCFTSSDLCETIHSVPAGYC